MREFYLYIQSGWEVLNRKGRNLLAPCCYWLLWHPHSMFTIVIRRSEKQEQYFRILKNWQREDREKIFLQNLNFACCVQMESLALKRKKTYSGYLRGYNLDLRGIKNGRENYTLRNFIICTIHQILLGRQNEVKQDVQNLQHAVTVINSYRTLA